MVRLFGCLVAFALFARPVSACINDRELASHEREFRSEYSRQAYPSPKVKVGNSRLPLILGGGSALLGGAFVAVFRLSSKPKG